MFSAAKTAGPSGYNINNSLRFRSSASAYLNRTPASATNQKTWTLSGWVKRGILGSNEVVFSADDGTSNNFFYIEIISADTLSIYQNTSGSAALQLTTTQVFRDPSAWYHIVVAVDTTQATSSNRVKLYINGSQVTAFGTATYPSQNANTQVNSTSPHYFGRLGFTTNYFDGYQTENNFIDGQALTPSSFGSTNATTGVWQPAKYTGTYGTNGFYLKFSNIALTSGSNTGLGQDFSGNGNYWNTNNISVTAGATYDAMTDVPTLTSPTVANYATFNPLKNPFPDAVSYSNANLAVSVGNANQTPALTTIYPSSGKWYWEVIWTSGSYARIGVQNATVASTDFAADVYGWRWESNTGYIYNGSNGTLSTVSTYATGDVLGFCLDCDAGKLYVSKNGTWQNSAVPASGTGAVATNLPTATLMSPAVATGSLTSAFAINCGQRGFAYTPPSGFNAINTYNLPTSTIVQGNKVMDATLYTGTGSTQSITNASAFKPDLIWTKSRSSGTLYNNLMDSVRGTNKDLYSNSTSAEDTNANIYTAINSNGFSVGTDNSANQSGQTFVGWQWQAGQGSTSSNTNGSITSTVSVNASAGFSIVTYTGTGGSATIGHGLGVAPAMVIIKNRTGTANDWMVKHKSLSSNNNLFLDLTSAQTNPATNGWIGDLSSSTTVSLVTGSSGNANTNANGTNFVAYCWAAIPGFSAFGSYTGNGSSDGPFVYTGFRPKYVLIKNITTTGQIWFAYDTSRSPYNLDTAYLAPNSSNAEAGSSVDNPLDILSNGFKIRYTNTGTNTNGDTYIYAAFAENPFKNALAR